MGILIIKSSKNSPPQRVISPVTAQTPPKIPKYTALKIPSVIIARELSQKLIKYFCLKEFKEVPKYRNHQTLMLKKE